MAAGRARADGMRAGAAQGHHKAPCRAIPRSSAAPPRRKTSARFGSFTQKTQQNSKMHPRQRARKAHRRMRPRSGSAPAIFPERAAPAPSVQRSWADPKTLPPSLLIFVWRARPAPPRPVCAPRRTSRSSLFRCFCRTFWPGARRVAPTFCPSPRWRPKENTKKVCALAALMLRRVSAGMAASSGPSLSPNGCDLVKLIAATGSSCRVLRLWRGGEPYFCRPQVMNMLSTTSDKRFRAAVAKALGEEDEVSTQTAPSFMLTGSAQLVRETKATLPDCVCVARSGGGCLGS